MRWHNEEATEKHPELPARDQKATRRACRSSGPWRTAITPGGRWSPPPTSTPRLAASGI